MSEDVQTKTTILLSEQTRRAIAIFAAENHLTFGEALKHLAEQLLPEQMERAKQAMAEGRQPLKPPPRRKP